MKKILLSLLVFFLLIDIFAINDVRAANISLIGNIETVKEGEDFDFNDYQLILRKIGTDQIWQGGLSRDGDNLNFNLPMGEVEKNDQLVLTIEANARNASGRETGFFGGKTIVVTADQVDKGLIDDIKLEMRSVPIPEYEQTDEKTIKLCWKGMSDFSVIGYEIYRSDEKVGDSWQMVGRSGQNANKQVCFLDSTYTDKAVYYRLAVLTSWNAGENKEVYTSKVMSEISDGLKFNDGIVDRLLRKKEIMIDQEGDQTISAVSENEEKKGIVRYWSLLDNWFQEVYVNLKANNISPQFMIVVILAIILLIVIFYFILSVWLSNVTSKGSNVWREK